jgi:hypothetical protein
LFSQCDDAFYECADHVLVAEEELIEPEIKVSESEALPPGHRQIIRRYFEAIRPDAGEADAVLGADVQ